MNKSFRVFLIPFIFCSIWFIFDYRFAPKASYYLVLGIKLLLLYGTFFKFGHFSNFRKYTINYILLWVILTELLLNQNSPFKLLNSILQSNLLLIFLIPFYFERRDDLIVFIKTNMIFILITVIIIGFYQYFAGKPIFDFYKYLDTSTIYSIENMRFTGLIYADTSSAANALGIFGIYYYSMKKFVNRRDVFKTTFAYLIGFATVIFTLTRASWIALFIVIIGNWLFIRDVNQEEVLSLRRKNIFSKLVIVILLLVSFLFINFIFTNYIMQYFSGEVDRLNSIGTFEYRSLRWSLFLANSSQVLFAGFGIIQDSAESLRQLIGGSNWGTVHNQIFEFAIAFGFMFTLFIYYRIIRAIVFLYKHIKKCNSSDSKVLFIFLIFSQIFIFINEMAASNPYYFSIFILTISELIITNIKSYTESPKLSY